MSANEPRRPLFIEWRVENDYKEAAVNWTFYPVQRVIPFCDPSLLVDMVAVKDLGTGKAVAVDQKLRLI